METFQKMVSLNKSIKMFIGNFIPQFFLKITPKPTFICHINPVSPICLEVSSFQKYNVSVRNLLKIFPESFFGKFL